MNRFLNSLPIRIFFWTLALFFIGFIFYKIFFKNGIFDGLKSRKRRNEDEEDSVESLGEFSEYDALIAEAESNNNFNLSSRYLYLKTLKTLYDKGLINFSPDKTNGEYLQEMSSHPYHGQFVALTRNYEYAWYGTFLISEAQYKKLKRQFIEFNKKIYHLRTLLSYGLWYYFFGRRGCRLQANDRRLPSLNENYRKTDKLPFGSFVAYNGFKHIFYKRTIETY